VREVRGRYDLIVVGTGFASTFFLQRYLMRAASNARVLVLERGERQPHAWHLQNQEQLENDSAAQIINPHPHKLWRFSITFGGCSNSWWACAPRMLPSDFETHTRYGYGRDWPLSYADLEPYYCEAEALMSVAGSQGRTPFPMSRRYPQAPHRLTLPDTLLMRAYPEAFYPLPCARPTQALPSLRPACCGSIICHRCPIDAKFSIANEMSALFTDARVTLRTGANVQAITIAGGLARGVRYTQESREHEVDGDLVALGANAIFNPYLLLRSGLDDPMLGRGLTEQASVLVTAWLDGVDNFQGSTSTTGHGYMLYDGPHRREHGAVLMETSNLPVLRARRGRQRQIFRAKMIIEDVFRSDNRVLISPHDAEKPLVSFAGHSRHTYQAVPALKSKLPSLLSPLPVEWLDIPDYRDLSEAHSMCSTVMGNDPNDSVVDRDLLHHRVRNLLVLGASTFASAAAANPTLTLCALSLRSADRLFGGRKAAV